MTGNVPCEPGGRGVSWWQIPYPMKNSIVTLVRPALLALGCVLAAVSLSAADKPLPPLPLQATFETSAPGDHGGPFCVKLTNTSERTLKVAALVRYSVVTHPSAKSKTVPAQKIAPGKMLTIDDLAVEDKVTLTAEGFEPLVLKVPPGKE